jgi:hypothetical protein
VGRGYQGLPHAPGTRHPAPGTRHFAYNAAIFPPRVVRHMNDPETLLYEVANGRLV